MKPWPTGPGLGVVCEVGPHEVLLLQELAVGVGRDGPRAVVDAEVGRHGVDHPPQCRRLRRPALHEVRSLRDPVPVLAVADRERAQRGRGRERAEPQHVVVAVDPVPGHGQPAAVDLLADRRREQAGDHGESVVAEPVGRGVLRVVRVVGLVPHLHALVHAHRAGVGRDRHAVEQVDVPAGLVLAEHVGGVTRDDCRSERGARHLADAQVGDARHHRGRDVGGQRLVRVEGARPGRVVLRDHRLEPGRALRVHEVHVRQVADVEDGPASRLPRRVGDLADEVQPCEVRLAVTGEQVPVPLVDLGADRDGLLEGADALPQRSRCREHAAERLLRDRPRSRESGDGGEERASAEARHVGILPY